LSLIKTVGIQTPSRLAKRAGTGAATGTCAMTVKKHSSLNAQINMTDRYNYFVVGLEKDIREDDAAALMAAIRQFKGVLSVTGNVSDSSFRLAEERARAEISGRLLAALYPKKGEK
jgi:hypothetical protein